MELNLNELLHDMVRKGASDLHLKAGNPPGMRIDGKIERQPEFGILLPDHTRAVARTLMNDTQWHQFEQTGDLDLSYAVRDLARFRVNALTQRSSTALVIRQIPDAVPSAESLGLPKICIDLAMKPRGLVVVTGPTGSGKSTTLAAMVDHINANHSGHILTMEDPLEFVHADQQCFVTQRQIGQDSASFAEALRRALRQDPDVIMIGEMRDLETISLAITAAETGHLVFGTLHTTSAISTVDRIIDVFPTDAQQQVRIQLASTLQGVISQCLIPKLGGGRVAAREIMIATDGVRSLIREGKTAQILNLLQTGRAHGMCTLENELIALANGGQIEPMDAVTKANRPAEVARNLGIDLTAPQSGQGQGGHGAGARPGSGMADRSGSTRGGRPGAASSPTPGGSAPMARRRR